MPSNDPVNSLPEGHLARVAAWVGRSLVGWLVASYALAAFLPAPGVAMQRLGVAEGGVAPVTFSLVMVGVLLLCGALSVDLAKLRELPQRPGGLVLALLGVWVPALIVVVGWSWIAPRWLSADQASALAIGLALAGAMPVANSAVAWTHQSGGSLAWALGLVVLSICLCPWVTPAVVKLMGLTLTGTDAIQAMSRFTGAVFVFWVLGPTLLGFAIRTAVGGEGIDRSRPVLTLASAASLLLLNYANASTALPSIVSEPDWRLLLVVVTAAVTLPIAGALAGWVSAGWAQVSSRSRVAWAYGLGMKNTGLALVLAGATLSDRPVVVLAILAVTLTQHAVAGVVHGVGVARAAVPEK